MFCLQLESKQMPGRPLCFAIIALHFVKTTLCPENLCLQNVGHIVTYEISTGMFYRAFRY